MLGIHLFRFAAGAALAAPIAAPVAARLLTTDTVTGALAWELAIFAVYLFNGVMDIQEDRVNGSRRPIAAGVLSRRAAVWVAICAALLALAGAAVTGMTAALAVAAVLVVGWQYSARPGLLKQRPAGTAVGGAAMGLLAYVTGYCSQAHAASTAVTPAAMAFVIAASAWMAFVGAPAKDLPDVPGDVAAGRRTLPALWGEHRTRLVIVASAVTIAFAFAAAAIRDPALLAAAAVTLAGGTGMITRVSLHPISTGSRARRRLPYRVFMVTQYATNACLLMTVLAR
ncbi:MAG TPA: UbiA family prenyltransferase [Streptosporangiaceae bacterium]|nr:UbiA family prenyltransferase [Streptosporangiaceae bacterium]